MWILTATTPAGIKHTVDNHHFSLFLLGENSYSPSIKSLRVRLQRDFLHCLLRTFVALTRDTIAMVSIQSKWRYLFMFLGIQLVVMALLSREGYQKRVSYFIRIFRKPDATAMSGRNHTTPGIAGGDVYANLSHLSKPHGKADEMPYCPKKSPLIGE